MTLHDLIVMFKTLGACVSLEPRYCRTARCVASRDALAVNLATAEVLGLSLPRHLLPRRRVDRVAPVSAAAQYVRLWHLADITALLIHVRFRR